MSDSVINRRHNLTYHGIMPLLPIARNSFQRTLQPSLNFIHAYVVIRSSVIFLSSSDAFTDPYSTRFPFHLVIRGLNAAVGFRQHIGSTWYIMTLCRRWIKFSCRRHEVGLILPVIPSRRRVSNLLAVVYFYRASSVTLHIAKFEEKKFIIDNDYSNSDDWSVIKLFVYNKLRCCMWLQWQLIPVLINPREIIVKIVNLD